jgi:excisionase family DNA binding protein
VNERVDEFMTTHEAAEALDVSAGRVRQWVAEGRLWSVKRGSTRFVLRAEVERMPPRDPTRPTPRRPRPEAPASDWAFSVV